MTGTPHLEKMNQSKLFIYWIWCPVIFFPCISNKRTRPRMFLINQYVRHYNECERKRQLLIVFILSHTQTTVHTLTGVHDTVTESMCMSVHAQQAITAACSASSLAFPPSQWLAVMWLMTVICWALFAPWLVPKSERERERDRDLLVLKSYLFPS